MTTHFSDMYASIGLNVLTTSPKKRKLSSVDCINVLSHNWLPLWLGAIKQRPPMLTKVHDTIMTSLGPSELISISKASLTEVISIPGSHWGPNKMATILQTTLSNAFFLVESFMFWLKFHWALFLEVQLAISQHWFKLWFVAEQATSHYLNQCWPIFLTRLQWVLTTFFYNFIHFISTTVFSILEAPHVRHWKHTLTRHFYSR